MTPNLQAFLQAYSKFQTARVWLYSKGLPSDRQAFNDRVVNPLRLAWAALSYADRQELSKIKRMLALTGNKYILVGHSIPLKTP